MNGQLDINKQGYDEMKGFECSIRTAFGSVLFVVPPCVFNLLNVERTCRKEGPHGSSYIVVSAKALGPGG